MQGYRGNKAQGVHSVQYSDLHQIPSCKLYFCLIYNMTLFINVLFILDFGPIYIYVSEALKEVNLSNIQNIFV